jgi:hypothetical protein
MKLKLDIEEMCEAFFEDTFLLGIVAPMKDYQFCWQLNTHFRLNFRANPEVEILLTKKNRQYFFSIYEYCEPNSSLKHYLYNNHNDGEFLLPEFKHLDFLWLMKDDMVAPEYLTGIMQAIRSLNGVQMVSELTNEKIKNKGHLMF